MMCCVILVVVKTFDGGFFANGQRQKVAKYIYIYRLSYYNKMQVDYCNSENDNAQTTHSYLDICCFCETNNFDSSLPRCPFLTAESTHT